MGGRASSKESVERDQGTKGRRGDGQEGGKIPEAIHAGITRAHRKGSGGSSPHPDPHPRVPRYETENLGIGYAD